MQKKCQKCGKLFTAGQGNYRYCPDCRDLMRPPIAKPGEVINGNTLRIDKTAPNTAINPFCDNYHAEDKEEPLQGDMVNHPKHYRLNNGLESIDVIKAALTPEEYRGWCKGNALKYQFRARKKDPDKLTEDYEKAMFFLKELVK